MKCILMVCNYLSLYLVDYLTQFTRSVMQGNVVCDRSRSDEEGITNSRSRRLGRLHWITDERYRDWPARVALISDPNVGIHSASVYKSFSLHAFQHLTSTLVHRARSWVHCQRNRIESIGLNMAVVVSGSQVQRQAREVYAVNFFR